VLGFTGYTLLVAEGTVTVSVEVEVVDVVLVGSPSSPLGYGGAGFSLG
jgi:hypothetical protein